LRWNGIRVRADRDDLYQLVIGVAEGSVSKAQVAVYLEESSG